MPKVKYYFNTHSLKYEKVVVSLWKRLLKALAWLATAVVFSVVIILVYNYSGLSSPKELQLKRQLEETTDQIEILRQRAANAEAVLNDIQQRDNTIYRVIFEADPIPAGIREAGYGGVDKYKQLKNYYNGEMLTDAAMKID